MHSLARLQDIQSATPAPIDQGVDVLSLTSLGQALVRAFSPQVPFGQGALGITPQPKPRLDQAGHLNSAACGIR